MALITQAFDSLDSYIAFFSLEAPPVLKHTAKELQAMREHEDNINGRTVAALVLGDPMMTLKVLIHIEAKRRARQNHDITTTVGLQGLFRLSFSSASDFASLFQA